MSGDNKRTLVFGNTAEFLSVEKLRGVAYNNVKDTFLIDVLIPGLSAKDLSEFKQDPEKLSAFVTEVSEKYYQDQDKEIYDTNRKIQKIVDEFGMVYFDRHAAVCDEAQERCHILTDDFYKTLNDYGHYTLNGAAFFGKRIINMGLVEEMKMLMDQK